MLPAVPGAEVAFLVTIPKHGAPSAAAAVVRDVAFEGTVPRTDAPPAVSSLAARHAGTRRARAASAASQPLDRRAWSLLFFLSKFFLHVFHCTLFLP